MKIFTSKIDCIIGLTLLIALDILLIYAGLRMELVNFNMLRIIKLSLTEGV